MFDKEFCQVAELGELGPSLCQFRDISSICCFDPNRHNNNSSSSSADTAFAVVPRSGFVDDEVVDVLPAWYRGVQCFEDLEEMLYEESFTGNFLVAQRKRRTFHTNRDDMKNKNQESRAGEGEDSDLEELPRTSSLSNYDYDQHGYTHGQHSIDQTDNVNHNTHDDHNKYNDIDDNDDDYEEYDSFQHGDDDDDGGGERGGGERGGGETIAKTEEALGGVFDVLFISRAKKLDHLLVKENKNPAFESGYYISNSLSSERETYPCLIDLLRAQKQHRFTLGGDRRPFVFVAVCDQGNYRVQVFRFYWTNNFMFRPELQLAYVIGGAGRSYVELFDPSSVAYTNTGEMCLVFI